MVLVYSLYIYIFLNHKLILVNAQEDDFDENTNEFDSDQNFDDSGDFEEINEEKIPTFRPHPLTDIPESSPDITYNVYFPDEPKESIKK